MAKGPPDRPQCRAVGKDQSILQPPFSVLPVPPFGQTPLEVKGQVSLQGMRVPGAPLPCQHLLLSILLAILVSGLDLISLMTNGVGYFFQVLIRNPLSVKYLSKSFAHLKIESSLLLLICGSSLH